MNWGRFSLASVFFLFCQSMSWPSMAYKAVIDKESRVGQLSNSLFPIETSPATGDSVDDLFPTQPRTTPPSSIIGNKPVGPISGAGSNSFRSADTKSEFRCNLFENADVIDVLSALNSLNQAVGSVSCGGKFINVQSVQDNNQKISDAVKTMQGFLQNPTTVQPKDAPTIVNNVDIAIRAANALATTFANSDLMDESCRNQMNSGEIALALNEVLNGLTPYALMAATMTGGTVAVPFIVGGAILTGTLSSVNKIVTENSVKIADAQVRRAVVENTCQFIRLDQKYKFLIKDREDQISQILKEVTSSQNLFSNNIRGFSDTTNGIILRKNSLNNTALAVQNKLASAKAQLVLDKTFVASTNDELKVCQMGIQLAELRNDPKSYVSVMLDSINTVTGMYGMSNKAEASALKASGQIAIKSLQEFSIQVFNIDTDFSRCGKATRSFIGTLEDSVLLANSVINSAQERLDKELKDSPDYYEFESEITTMNEKQLQAERVTVSLDNLRHYATTFSQSEIDSELDRLRGGLFGPRKLGMSSPVMAWFKYVEGLHKSSVDKFMQGLKSLRAKSLATLNKSKKTEKDKTENAMASSSKLDVMNQYAIDSFQLKTYNTVFLPLGSKEYLDACREMQDVWNRWVIAIDHLSAIESFCKMIDPYIYDSRSEDKDLVQMCRGASGGPRSWLAKLNNQKNDSLNQLKDNLISDKTSSWAQLVKTKLDGLSCPQVEKF